MSVITTVECQCAAGRACEEAREGLALIDQAAREMQVLTATQKRFEIERPLEGLRVACCLHVTAETACLMVALQRGGADVVLVTCNPLTIQVPIQTALTHCYGVEVFAQPLRREYNRGILAALDRQPDIVVDDGGDLIAQLHEQRPALVEQILGGTEQTTSGIARLHALDREGSLNIPVVEVNTARTKRQFDNHYGTGQSSVEGLVRAANILLAGKTVVVGGYGHCGKGLAKRFKGMGSSVIVTEVDPVAALEAVMDGFRVLPMREAAGLGDVFVVSTGVNNVLDREHFSEMKDGALLANAGHLDVEINVAGLAELAVSERRTTTHITEYTLHSGRTVGLLCEGRLVNLVAASGHPSGVMDLSFANQALAVEYIALSHPKLAPGLHRLPPGTDAKIASLKLCGMGVQIDSPTVGQELYRSSWRTPDHPQDW